MRRAWASFFTAVLLYGCGGAAGPWQPVEDTAQGGGLEISLVRISMDDRTAPWRGPLRGTHCFLHELRARSTDGAWHELRPEQFKAGEGTPLDAVGHCSSPQLEPTWIGSAPRMLSVTVLEHSATPATLLWRPVL